MPKQNNKWKNKLYFGDNLDILKNKISDNFVDLIYLDPPFQSGKSYNQIFQPEQGEIKGTNAQIKAFEDTWQWGIEAEKNYEGLITGEINKEKPNQKLIDLIKAIRAYLGEVPMMAYLSMMAPRLLEMKRILKNTGSIYLHCDPTASHYLKLLMDAVFGSDNFQNEIIWCYKTGGATKKRFGKKHDIIFFYTKTPDYKFNPQKEKSYMMHEYGFKKSDFQKDEKGQYSWVIAKDWWEIPALGSATKERIGYPTQKPEALLEKIIKASSNKGDLVLDPFCGCGTTVAVAQKLGRRWIGIDITYIAINVISKRLEKSGFVKGNKFIIEGEPKDIYSAKKLSEQNHIQFEIWCISKLNAIPTPRQDQGIDGIINFVDLTKKDKAGKIIIQVKGTKAVNPAMVRDLKGTMKSQNADIGILITLKKATRGMIAEATKDGFYLYGYTKDTLQLKIPRIQLLTVEDLLKEFPPLILPPVIRPFKTPTIVEESEQTSILEFKKKIKFKKKID